MADGTSSFVNWTVKLNLRLRTIVGIVHIADPVECLTIPDSFDECLLGNDLLLNLGIDLERQIDLLAVPLAANENEDEFDENEGEFNDADEPTLGKEVLHEEEVRTGILELIKLAITEGFPREF
ncbi:hypothetical protein ON010_g16834 [Phytophthora cinnamomi]|nr:hypothetical protein ON010_g16834 [Phytophthora cinnamomi]